MSPVERILEDEASTPDGIERTAAALLEERLVAMPADTVYGLHGLARSPTVIGLMDQAKTRSDDKPYLVLAGGLDQIVAITSSDDQILAALEQIWPAPLTAILPSSERLAAGKRAATIAVRVPDDPWLLEILGRTGPLASSSLNRSGEPTVVELPPSDLLRQIGVTFAVDRGTRSGQASTIVDFTQPTPAIVREGAFGFSQKLWKTVWKTL